MSYTLKHDVMKTSVLFTSTISAEKSEIENKSRGNNGHSVVVVQKVLSHYSLTNV